MWKLFTFTAICLQLVCGQCGFQRPCDGERPVSTPRTILEPFTATTPVQQTEYTVEQNVSRVATKAPQPMPPIRIVFPDEFENIPVPSESFNAKLFQLMSADATNRNLCYSPLSLQTLLTFISTLSEGKLLQELSTVLDLPRNPSQVAQSYQSLTQAPHNTDSNNTLIVASKLYYDQRYGLLSRSVRNLASHSFASELEALDFLTPQTAADTINAWVSEKTRKLIQNIISPGSISSYTSALLINSMYFKSEWLTKFSPRDTEKQRFFINKEKEAEVEMMYIEDIFSYGEFEQLGATVLEMPYKLDDFSMMIILPKEIDGLAEVERRLTQTTMKLLSVRLQRAEVTVKLPKFQIEFDTDMVQPLQRLGLQSLFNSDARINIFKNQQKPLIVDQIRHKTFINVNEAGTEAAAVSFANFVPLSIPVRVKRFTADHPFIFVIRNSKAVYFIGHVAQF